jgi:hypothetical protein
MKRLGAVLIALFLPAGCATEGTSGTVGVGYYHGGYYDDWWYGSGGCCVDYPGDIGPPPPRPEHPIALPPGSTPRPEHPIATPPKAEPRTSAATSTRSSMPSPRPAAGGGMRGGGGGGRR